MSAVYFIRIGKFIKIGFTTNLAGRLKSFRTGTAESITVLLTIPGGRDLERRLHKLFHADRITGTEFFHDQWDICNFIDLTKQKSLDAAFEYIEWLHWARTPAGRARAKQLSEERYQAMVAERIRLRDARRGGAHHEHRGA
jgi:hypothetical protein